MSLSKFYNLINKDRKLKYVFGINNIFSLGVPAADLPIIKNIEQDFRIHEMPEFFILDYEFSRILCFGGAHQYLI